MRNWRACGPENPFWWMWRSCSVSWRTSAERTGRLLLIVLVVLLLGACSRQPRLPPLPDGSKVLVVGDSVSAGVGAGDGEDYPTLLAQRTGWEVVNAGVSGDTAAGARERLDALLAEHRPQFVIVEIGGNDLLQRRPPQQVQSDIRYLIERSKGTGARVLLVGVPAVPGLAGLVGSLDDAPLYAQLAEEQQVLLVPGVLAAILSDPALRADPIHPNAAGYRVLADGLVDAVLEAGWLRQARPLSTP